MVASPELIRKLAALRNRVDEALVETHGDERRQRFDPHDGIAWFERWEKIRAELIACESELADLPICPKPTVTTPGPKDLNWSILNTHGPYISRDAIERLRRHIADAADVLEHPSRAVPQISIDQEGIFTGGQPFDAMFAIRSIIKAAKSSITLVDNYVSDETLHLLSAKDDPVAVKIITQTMKPSTAAFVTAAKTFNAQYTGGPPLEVKTSAAFHDRFIAIDDADFYHFGASIKDAAKRNTFMFSKIAEPSVVTTLRAQITSEWTSGTVIAL